MNVSRHLPRASRTKVAAGRMLFQLCNALPPARANLRQWGLRTAGPEFGERVGDIRFPDGHRFKLASISQNYLSFELFWRGGCYYEPITRRLLEELVKPGDTFVDVGANVGFYTLDLATRCRDVHVIAFEPNPGNFALLRKNVATNALSNVRCEPLAVSDADQTATLYLTSSHMSASLRAGFDGAVEGTVEVPTVKLDTYLAPHVLPRRLVIKVDVEGHEEALFRGLQRTLAGTRPDIITEVALGYGPELTGRLAQSGYRFFQITDRGLVPSHTLQPVVRDRFVFLNYLLTTRGEDDVAGINRRLIPAIRRIDLTDTSKCLSPAELARFVARMNAGAPLHASVERTL